MDRIFCDECVFFHNPYPDEEPKYGYCHRYAPRFSDIGTGFGSKIRLHDWPLVDISDWCGEVKKDE